jgi:hypothetical protein
LVRETVSSAEGEVRRRQIGRGVVGSATKRQFSETGTSSIVAEMREAGACGDAVTATVKPAADPGISS